MRRVGGEGPGNRFPIHAQNYRGFDVGGVLGDEPVHLRTFQLPAGNPDHGIEPLERRIRRMRVGGLGIIDERDAGMLMDHSAAVPGDGICGQPLRNGLWGGACQTRDAGCGRSV